MKMRKIFAVILALTMMGMSVSVYSAKLEENQKTAKSASSGKEALRYIKTGSKFKSDTIKATWINIWYASSESWFYPNDSNGTRFYIDGKWTGMDWDSEATVNTLLNDIKDAGINVLVFDLTNGFHDFIIERSKRVAEACRERGIKICFAAGNTDNNGLNTRAEITWKQFCAPDAAFHDVYFQKDGKPVFVNYVIRSQWESIQNTDLEYLSKFTNVWASGKEADADKWGWQLMPSVGTVPSTDTMFVSGSIFWSPDSNAWCESLAYLDYNLLKASQSQPDILVLGSYDDVSEKNSWGYMDTANATLGEEFKMKDIYGNVSVDAYHDRVISWLSAEGPSVVSGGTLMDGCYKMKNKNSGLLLGTGSLSYVNGLSLEQVSAMEDLTDYVWLYHVGNDNYRIVRLTAGKSLAVSEDGMNQGDSLIQEYDCYTDRQFWKLSANADGSYTFQNNANDLVIGVADASTDEAASLQMEKKNDCDSQKWIMEPVLLMK